jgi:uncharacterized membrane protein YhaH (DUF805 family)
MGIVLGVVIGLVTGGASSAAVWYWLYHRMAPKLEWAPRIAHFIDEKGIEHDRVYLANTGKRDAIDVRYRIRLRIPEHVPGAEYSTVDIWIGQLARIRPMSETERPFFWDIEPWHMPEEFYKGRFSEEMVKGLGNRISFSQFLEHFGDNKPVVRLQAFASDSFSGSRTLATLDLSEADVEESQSESHSFDFVSATNTETSFGGPMAVPNPFKLNLQNSFFLLVIVWLLSGGYTFIRSLPDVGRSNFANDTDTALILALILTILITYFGVLQATQTIRAAIASAFIVTYLIALAVPKASEFFENSFGKDSFLDAVQTIVVFYFVVEGAVQGTKVIGTSLGARGENASTPEAVRNAVANIPGDGPQDNS